MTEVTNFFQAVFMFKNFAPISATEHEVKLAVSLKSEARTLAAKGDEEMRNGREAQILAFAATDKNKNRIFAEISVWHHQRAAEKYRKSAARFQEAAKIPTGKSRAFHSITKELMRRAAQAGTAVNLLNNFLGQN